MTLLAFVVMILAAQSHGSEMAMAEPDHSPAQMQSHAVQSHDGRASAQLQCQDQRGCHSDKDLCDLVCAGLTNTILAEAASVALLTRITTLARVSRGDALDGISPALDQRPPISLFA